MMNWVLYLLILSGFFSAVVSLYLYKDTGRYKFLGLLCASFFFITAQAGLVLQQIFFNQPYSFILKWLVQWGSICCIALVLSSLLFFLREMKPEILRYHLFYSVLPLLIIISFFLVSDSAFLKDRLLAIYEAGAVFVGVILYGMNCRQMSIFLIPFAGSLLIAASFIAHFVVPSAYEFAWRIAFAVGIITLFTGYLNINTSMHKMSNKKESMEKEWSYFS